MTEETRLDIEPPHTGWVTIRLAAPGVHLEFDASYTPRDSICMMAQAVTGMLNGLPEQVVVWNTEPQEYEFKFATEDGRTRLEVRQFPDRRRHGDASAAVVEGNTISIARAIWRGLRRLQGVVSVERFAQEWGYPFPASTVERIGEQLRSKSSDPRRSV